MTITLPGRVPSKKNSKRVFCQGARPRVLPSEAYVAWHEEMMLRLHRHRPKTPATSVSVAITFFAENRRRFDLTNAAESVMDLLVDAGILADDSWAVVPQVHLSFGGVEPKTARAEILIKQHTP